MTWQEYQDAVGEFYIRVEKIGIVKKNISIPDKLTGQKRQIDVWCEIHIGDHLINVLIDAKLRSNPIDVTVVDGVASLAESVKAHKAIIITNEGWTEPAKRKAEFIGMDIKILSIEEALGLVVPNKWIMCYDCNDECVVMDWDGVLYQKKIELFFTWYAGRCRKCKNLYLYCPACGNKTIIEDTDPWKCHCGHTWKTKKDQLFIKFNYGKKFLKIDNALKANAAFLHWLEGNDPKYWARDLVGKAITVGTDEEDLFQFFVTFPGPTN